MAPDSPRYTRSWNLDAPHLLSEHMFHWPSFDP